MLIARGSNDELQTQLILAERMGFRDAVLIAEAADLSDEIGKMLGGLHQFLQTPKKGFQPRTLNLEP